MEILVWLACLVVVNALCMAQIMRWQAEQNRGWHLTRGESLGLQAQASGSGLVCVLLWLVAAAWLQEAGTILLLALSAAVFFLPYYAWLRRAAYRLTLNQRNRGRGVARRNIRDIVHLTFGYALLIYGGVGLIVYMVWRSADQ